jgi:hypothetical protein
MPPLVAMGGGRLSFASALPRLVSAAAARMDRSSAVLAIGLGPNGRVNFRIDVDCRNVFTLHRTGRCPSQAGYVYGFWAFPLTYSSIAFASVLAFLAGRYLLRDKIQPLLNRRPKYRKLDRAVADDGWQVVVLMRLSPIVPFNLQNYALGVTAIPFMQYLTATLIGIAPGSRSTSTSDFRQGARKRAQLFRLGVVRPRCARDHRPRDPGDS